MNEAAAVLISVFPRIRIRNSHPASILHASVCAIASKFYDARPELHSRLTNLSRKLAFTVPEKGYKSVEIVQAYLLLTLWGSGPVERYEQDKTWFLLGMGIRSVRCSCRFHAKHLLILLLGTQDGHGP